MTQFEKDNPRESETRINADKSANIRAKKKILLIEPDKELTEAFTGWLTGEGYEVGREERIDQAYPALKQDGFSLLIADIDSEETLDKTIAMIQSIEKDTRFSAFPVTVLLYRTEIKKIARAIDAGIGNFIILKPVESDFFLKRLESVFYEIGLRSKGKKVLDLNYVNYLIDNMSDLVNRDDFFLLGPVIFNKLIIGKVNTILGPPVIAQIIKRANETVGMDYEFMKAVEFSGAGVSLAGVDRASKGADVKKITTAYRDYVYAFLHLVRMLTSDILMERGGAKNR